MLRRIVSALIFLLVCSALTPAQETKITVISWNVESGGAQPSKVAERIRSFQGVDLWGLSEVSNDSDASTFEVAAEDGESADFERITGTTGGADRLVIIFNKKRFDKISHTELHDINPGNRVRSPLVVRLKNKVTGQEFLFMVNHLYRGNNAERHKQAQLLNQWAAGQTLPVIAVGDYNFDWSVTNGDTDHDKGYDNITKDSVFTWVRPATLIRSQCSNFDSVLDFVFTSTPAFGWQKSAEILVVSGDCPDDTQNPDHRPVRAVLDTVSSSPPPPPVTKEQILQRIAALEAELRALRELVQRLP